MGMNEEFGRHLRRLRHRAQLTQNQLAAVARLSAATISNIERGVHAPAFRRLPFIANALRVEVYELFMFDK